MRSPLFLIVSIFVFAAGCGDLTPQKPATATNTAATPAAQAPAEKPADSAVAPAPAPTPTPAAVEAKPVEQAPAVVEKPAVVNGPTSDGRCVNPPKACPGGVTATTDPKTCEQSCPGE